jgi:hypothetical protein
MADVIGPQKLALAQIAKDILVAAVSGPNFNWAGAVSERGTELGKAYAALLAQVEAAVRR